MREIKGRKGREKRKGTEKVVRKRMDVSMWLVSKRPTFTLQRREERREERTESQIIR